MEILCGRPLVVARDAATVSGSSHHDEALLAWDADPSIEVLTPA
jgi:hypothetical protein